MDLREEFKEKGLPDGSESHGIRMESFPDALSVRFQDISQINCECIVNAADEKLSGEAGVDAAIHVAGRRNTWNMTWKSHLQAWI
ncbi:MAG: hypothetical protein LUF35_05025 [Lachnospiraceae bacterium]|nr:hypothetical protein [Lachnospiraceae bacterium]